MNLSCINIFIDLPSFQGILRASIVKQFHNLEIKIEAFKLQATDRQIISTVKQHCENDFNNANLLNMISSELVYSKNMNYNEVEIMVEYLSFINKVPRDDKFRNSAWNIVFQFANDQNTFKVALYSKSVLRLYNFMNSFYSFYSILDAMSKFGAFQEEKKQSIKENKKITEHIPIKKNVEEKEVISDTPIEKDETSTLIELCLNPSIKSSLIHYVFNYFRYITKEVCYFQKQENIINVICPFIIPSKIGMDVPYFRSLIFSNKSLNIEKVQLAVKKLLYIVKEENEKYSNPIHIMCISFLLFIYFLRYLMDTKPDFIKRNFETSLINTKLQTNIFNHFLTSIFSEYGTSIKFIIREDLGALNFENILIDQISGKYQHLIPVSQEKFADLVFKEVENNKDLPDDFQITTKKVINVNDYIKPEKDKVPSSVLLDPANTAKEEISLDNNIFRLLNYGRYGKGKVISNAYMHLLNYASDSSSVLMIKDDNIPKEVIKLFDLLSKEFLNAQTLTKDNCNTLEIYQKLLRILPSPKSFNHMVILYIIFQIVIPYLYDIYGTTQFVDVFL